MIALQLAWRSIRRNSRRSILVASAATIASLVLTLAAAFISGTTADLRASIIQGGVGHFQIGRTNTFDGYSENQLDNAMRPEQVSKVQDWADTTSAIKGVVPRILYGGLISNGPRTLPFSAKGIDPATEKSTFDSSIEVVDGSLLDSRSTWDSIVVGQGVAKQLESEVGSTLTLLSTMQSGAMNAVDVVVTGIVSTGSIVGDNLYIQTTMVGAQELLRTDRVSRIAVLAESSEVASKLLTFARTLDAELDVRDWQELTPLYSQVLGMYTGIFTFFGFTLGIVAALTIAGAVLTSVLERTSEIGLMRSLAIDNLTIRMMFCYEGVLLGLIGSVIGVIVGVVLVYVLGSLSITMPPPPGATTGYPLSMEWKPGMSFTLIVFFSFLAMVAAWIVSKRAVKLTILESFGKE